MAELRSDGFVAGFTPEGTYFEQMGEGPAIVFIHGLGCDSQMWSGLTALHSTHLTLTYDLVGHGRTRTTWDLLAFDTYVGQLADLLREREIRAATLVGFSMGGPVAVRMAEQHPSLVRGLCLSNVPFRRTAEELARAGGRIDLILSDGLPAASPSLVARWFPDNFLGDREDLACRLVDMLCRNRLGAFVEAYRLALEADELLERACPGISCPCLVLAGGLDASVNLAQANELAAAMNNGKLTVFEDAGHMLPIQCAPAFIEQVRGFSQSVG